jgi:hypothetical protein
MIDIDRRIDARRHDRNAIPANVLDDRVVNKSFPAVGFGDVNSVRGEAEDIAILNGERFAGKPADAIDSGPNAVDAEVPENHNIGWPSCHHNAVGAADQDGSNLSATAVKGNGLGNGKGAESCWIKGVNFATGGCFGDCACKRFARGSAAAGVSIIAHAGNPRPGGLGAG